MVSHGLRNVSLLRHGIDFFATVQRDNAACQVLQKEYESINICASASFISEENVYNATVQLIRDHPETEALYISWEGPAVEAMRALNDLGRSNIAIATCDLDFNTSMLLAEGGMIKATSTQCPYEQGEAMAWAAANAMLDKPTPSFIGIEPVVVTAKNLLKTWKSIYKEDPPSKLKEALRRNPNFFTTNML